MINKFLNLFRKKEPTLVWRHIHLNQWVGVIGWLATDRKTFIKGEDTWKRK